MDDFHDTINQIKKIEKRKLRYTIISVALPLMAGLLFLSFTLVEINKLNKAHKDLELENLNVSKLKLKKNACNFLMTLSKRMSQQKIRVD